MGKLVVFGLAALLALMASPAWSEEEPTFHDFEVSCRLGDGIDPSCENAVVGAYLYLSKAKTAQCEWAKFWSESDASIEPSSAAEPWQIGVGMIVQKPGVCRSAN